MHLEAPASRVDNDQNGQVDEDDDCKHGLAAGTCSVCSGKETALGSTRSKAGGRSEALDNPEAIEKYRMHYPGDREATFDAYVKVFFEMPEANKFPGGWTAFSKSANAEPKRVSDDPALVTYAESLMRKAGYEADDSGRPGRGRRWVATE